MGKAFCIFIFSKAQPNAVFFPGEMGRPGGKEGRR